MAAQDWVDGFLDRAATGLDIDRVVQDAPGVDATTITHVLGDGRLGSHVIEAMSDLVSALGDDRHGKWDPRRLAVPVE